MTVPVPEGFTLDPPARPSRLPGTLSVPPRADPNLLKPLLDLGVEPTNGYRTPQDIQRLRAQGYTAATNSGHLAGDDVDLTPGKSGLTLPQLQARANMIASKWPNGSAAIHNGTHVHLALPGWGMAPGTPGTPNFGLPPLPPGFTLEQRGSLRQGNYMPGALAPMRPTGQVHDGDTFQLSTGQNGRLLGVDAFELNQQGHTPSGAAIPLGTDARIALSRFAVPGGVVTPTGAFTYGRPVVTLENGGDAGQSILRQGSGLAEPQYLRGSPLFGPYMEAERQARMNLLGAHGNTYETPQAFRHGAPDPWQHPEAAKQGEPGTAVFGDEPMPFAGLRPEIAKGYLAIWDDPKSKPDDLIAYADASGFKIDPAKTRKAYEHRNDPRYATTNRLSYERVPRPMIDPGDGRFGTTLRGVADPINFLDEFGGIADTLGGTSGRENLFNSDRRFGDILWNNIDQNRDILAHDEATHPFYRLGGQIAGSLAVPVIGAEASIPRLAALGAAGGGLAGFGAGEGGLAQRFPGAVVGSIGGAALGGGLGGLIKAAPFALNAGRRLLGRSPGALAPDAARVAEEAAFETAPVGNEGAQVPASRPPGGVASAAMADEHRMPELVGPMPRKVDRIDVGHVPEGFTLDAPFGVTRPINERLNADEIASLARGVDPAAAIPRPANTVESLDEAIKANPGRFEEVRAPDERDALPKLTIRAPGDLFRSSTRRDIYDATKFLRASGGIRDEGGDLAHLGITNAPRRDLPFGRNEQFLGSLINPRGMTLDEAGEKLWDAGYFRERPTPAELLDVLHGEQLGHSLYHPSDLADVEEFHHLQAQRYGIEEKQALGVPLVEDRGTAINLDDLAANAPPASAYEDAPRLTGKVGNINLDRLEKPGDVSALIDQISNRVGGFSAAARGKVTHDETQALATELGLTPQQLLKRRQGQALNAEQLYASRSLVQRSRETVARLAKKAAGGSDEDVATFRKAWLAHVALEEQVSGATAEAGRALSQMRMLANAQDAGANAVRDYLKGIGGKQSIEDAASAIVDLMEDPAKAGHFMREAVKPRWRDKFNELWVNSLLSGPRTHVVNFVGNALTTLMSFPELATTATIGKVTRSEDRALFGEVGARAAGLADSSVDALRAMRTAFRTGEPLDATAKVENLHHEAIGGTLGKVIRTPTRALTAADEFWKSILTHGELRQSAYRTAFRETRDPEAFQARYEELARAPTEEMLKQAHASARYWTFQKELGPTGRAIQQVSNNWVLGKILLPFVRTPSNIIKFAGERSAFGLLMPEVRQALKAGGRARDEALAKITLGSGLSTAAVVAALHGRITGSGPADPRERAALLQSGWQPNSIRVGDRWVSFSRFDPVATLIGIAADFAEAGKWGTKQEADKVALNLGVSIANNITNKTWLSGLSDAFDVLSDPQRYGKHYVQKLAGSLAVPAIVAQSAQALDPNLRDARSIVDAIKARVPVLSESVPVRRNVWGEPVSAGNAVGPDILSPFYASKISADPLNTEIARLRPPLSMPERSLTIEGKSVPLDAKQYDELVQLSGQPAKRYLGDLIRTPDWQSMGDDERRAMVKQTLADFRHAGRDELLERHPELVSAAHSAPSGFVLDGAAPQQRVSHPGSLAPSGHRALQVPPQSVPQGFALDR